MWSFGALCDEFSVNAKLQLKLELDPNRDSLLHFFEQLRRRFPTLARLRRRDDGGLVLDEEDRPGEGRRFVRLDANAVRFGAHGPQTIGALASFGAAVLEQAPFQLSLSELDYDFMEVVYSFDFEYRGNHDELIAETLFADHPLVRALTLDDERLIDCQPFLGIALSHDCETQVYLDMKGRTTTFELRTGEFEPAPISVYLTVRRYWGAAGEHDLAQTFETLLMIGQQYAEERIVQHVLQPLAAAIASRR